MTRPFVMPVEFHSMHSDLFDQVCIFGNDTIRVFYSFAAKTKDYSHFMGQVEDELSHTFFYEDFLKKVVTCLSMQV